MLALMATVGLAFGAKADGLTAYEGSTAFETAAFVVDEALPAADEGQTGESIQYTFWSGNTSDSKVVEGSAGTDVAYYKTGAHTKYASLEGSDVLLRQAYAAGTGVKFGSIYFDTMVQFTASDGDVTPETGDKLIVWLKADEENNTTNLIITAGVLDEELYAVGVTNYTVTGNYQAGEWYRLTVKTYPTIGLAATVPGFRVFIDGTEVAVTGAALYNGYFASIVSRAVGTQTLTGIGFKGTGAVDDIAMTTTDPIEEVAPTTVALTVAVTGETGYLEELTYKVNSGTPETYGEATDVVANEGDTITLDFFVYDGFSASIGGETLTPSGEASDDRYPYTFSVTVTQEMIENGLTLTINVTEDGGEEVPESAEVVADGGTVTVKAASEEAAVEAVTVKGVNGTVYADSQKYYTKAATSNGDNWDVTVTLNKTALEEDVDTAVATALEDLDTAEVTLPAGFYYMVESGTDVSISTKAYGTSTGAAIGITGLGENAGFFKVTVDTASLAE